MIAIVTGSAGYFGRHLVPALERQGWTVHGLDLAAGCDVVSDPLAGQPPGPVEAVIHLAAVASIGACEADPRGAWRTNVLGTQRVCDLAQRVGARRFVLASSASVYGRPAGPQPLPVSTRPDPISVYGRTKLTAEQVVREHFLGDVVVLRPFNLAGGSCRPEDSRLVPAAVRAAVTGRPLPLRQYGSTRDYCDVHVAAEAVCDLAAKATGHQVVHLASGRGSSTRDLLAAVARVTGRPVPLGQVATGPDNGPEPLHLVGERSVDWCPPSPDLDAIVASVLAADDRVGSHSDCGI